jgi:hypothetical protein
VSGFRPSVPTPPSSSARLSALRVVLPDGLAYWTVVDENYELVEAADGFLRDLRFGADRTESTTRLYASELALFLDWSTASPDFRCVVTTCIAPLGLALRPM